MRFCIAVLAISGAALPGAANAGLVQISTPDAAYTSATTNIALVDPDGTDLTSIGDGTLTIDFSHIRQVQGIGSGWATWGSPPDTESSTPRVLIADDYQSFTTLTMTFSQPLDVFGVEAESDNFGAYAFTADFYDGAALVGSITRTIEGNAGARLLAADAFGGDVFTSVVISTDDDFALAQFRYGLATDVPEPATLGLLGLGFAAIGFSGRRKTA